MKNESLDQELRDIQLSWFLARPFEKLLLELFVWDSGADPTNRMFTGHTHSIRTHTRTREEWERNAGNFSILLFHLLLLLRVYYKVKKHGAGTRTPSAVLFPSAPHLSLSHASRSEPFLQLLSQKATTSITSGTFQLRFSERWDLSSSAVFFFSPSPGKASVSSVLIGVFFFFFRFNVVSLQIPLYDYTLSK